MPAKKYFTEDERIAARKTKKAAWRLLNKDKIAAARSTQEFKSWAKEYHAAWYLTNKEHISKTTRIWQDANKEKCRERARIWQRKNKIYFREYKRRKINSDAGLIIENRLRSRLHIALAKDKSPYSASILKYVGCSISELKVYIESLFTDGMSWNNRSEWHIDHMLPCAAFDHHDENEIKKCWHYTNLRPIWEYENRYKSSFVDGKYITRKNRAFKPHKYAQSN